MTSLPLAWRLFRRELARGQLRLIAAALILAVTAVSGLGLVSDRLKRAIDHQAATFLAADRILNSPQEVDPAWLEQARSLGVAVATTLEFQSMLFAGDELQLVTIKAVSDGYPLRGDIEMMTPGTGALPSSGSLWLDRRLASWLQSAEEGEVGEGIFRLEGVINRLPDAGFNVFASAPVVLMRLDDVAQTGVIQPGSRLQWRYQFAGRESAIAELERFLEPRLTTSQRLVDVRSQESPLARAIGRAEQFLLLSALLGIALACAAIGVAARRYCQRHYDVVAMFKTLGASHGQVRTIFVSHLALVTLLSIVAGLGLGWLAAQGMIQLLPAEFGSTAMDAFPWRPLALGAGTGVIAGFGFTLYPLLRLLSVPPMRVLRQDIGPARWGAGLNGLLALTALSLLAWLYSGSWKMTLVLIIGALVLGGLLALVGLLLLRSGRQLGMATASPLKLALAGLRRRASDNALQLVGFSVALMLLLTILALRQDLLSDWQAQLPQNTPDHFLVNIAPEDTAALETFLAERQVRATDLYPVIRGRLSAINGETVQRRVTKEDEEEPQGPRGIGRELNLTYRTELPPNNPVVAGQWYGADSLDEVSVEARVAERLGIGLGDSLSFTIDGREFSVTVTSLRQVNWETMQPNFFMIFPPAVLEPFVATYIASFYHPEGQPELVGELIRQFPTVSVIDVGALIEQLRGVIDQVSLALSLVLLVVVVASALVLLAQTEAGMASRRQELAIMRTLGAPGRLLRSAVNWEFMILGALAGLMAVMVAELTLYLLKTQVFNLVVQAHWLWWALTPVLGAILIGLMGRFACRRLLAQNCAALLRRD
ncbi:FtsX-like permease family protein [Ferrimonas balearica]|uniref:ABC transporter permease n=1 Tax=Ferrimonas balearica TaxID=44012 RepID=UPI001C5981C1|nr:FtsX-like permease family protein [Ferrimonas balearica]MBW3140244.1 FtsX-like permease family protein [Ferrimonas balearica]MBY6106647.1 FtsX-like permease family protein [Ferrimonas balearica]